MAESAKSKTVAIATNKNVLIFVGVLIGAAVLYKTKVFGLLEEKGQPKVDEAIQPPTIYVPNPTTGQIETQVVPPLSANEAENIAIAYHDKLSEAWGLSGWFGGFAPTDAEYNAIITRLLNLSNQQLAQVCNSFANKYKGDTYNTVRKLLDAVWVNNIGGQSQTNRTALQAKLNSINA